MENCYGCTQCVQCLTTIDHTPEIRNVCRLVVGKCEGKRFLGRPRRRWEGNINIEVKQVESKVWIGFIWLRIGTSDRLF
jgi:hypothetical protein